MRMTFKPQKKRTQTLEAQCEQILHHMSQIDPHTGDSSGITPYEAIGLFKCFRLAARIHDLRKRGVKILTLNKKDSTGRKYVKYYLSPNKSCRKEGTVSNLPGKWKGQ